MRTRPNHDGRRTIAQARFVPLLQPSDDVRMFALTFTAGLVVFGTFFG